jgi:hypothetical protein
VFVAIRARLPGPERSRLPAWMIERLRGEPSARLEALLRWLLPITIAEGGRAR